MLVILQKMHQEARQGGSHCSKLLHQLCAKLKSWNSHKQLLRLKSKQPQHRLTDRLKPQHSCPNQGRCKARLRPQHLSPNQPKATHRPK